MKRINLLNLFSSILLISLLFFVTSSCQAQNSSNEILEQYRLKIIGETINLVATNDTIAKEDIASGNLSAMSIRSHVESGWRNTSRTKELLLALLDSKEYDGKKVPTAGEIGNINDKSGNTLFAFASFIEANINFRNYTEDKQEIFKRNVKKWLDECKGKLSDNDLNNVSDTSDKKENIDADNKTVERKKANEDALPKAKEESSGGINIWNILSIFNFLFLFFLLVLLFIKRKNLNEQFEKMNKKIIDNNDLIKETFSALQIKDEKLQSDINNVDIKIIGLENKILKLGQRIPETDVGRDASIPIRPKIETPPPIIRKYSAYPDTPVGFLIANLSSSETSDSRYEFLMENDNVASFIFKASPNETEYAINNAQMILRSACDYSNSPNDGKKIRTDKPGRLIRDGEVWRIVDKAKISFYN
jgi:hypothetical protein